MVVPFFNSNERIANEPFGVGTRTAVAVNLSFRSGITFVTAAPAPVEVITMLIAAERPRREDLCMLSNKF
ncbi:hypothetical protein D3C80_1722410 [compost metagenome]